MQRIEGLTTGRRKDVWQPGKTGILMEVTGMPDREKVIKGLECLLSDRKCDLRNCPYGSFDSCINAVLSDALELLKEQYKLLCKKQKDIDKLQADYAMLRHKFLEKTQIVRCKDCKHYKDGKCFYTMRRHGLKDDWFCADG